LSGIIGRGIRARRYGDYVVDLAELEQIFLLSTSRLQAYINLRIPPGMRARLAAEDVLQDVWVLASRRVEQFQPQSEESTHAWLTRIARNALVDRIKERHRDKRSGNQRKVPGHFASSMLGAFEIIAALQRTPSQDARLRETERSMKAALSRLPDNRREALWMKYIDEVPTSAIAEKMGKSESAVRSLIAEGLRQLRRIMGHPASYFSDDARSDLDAR